ncbi:hypothetical protein D3C75_823940 [compost metagenome]
MQLDHQIELRTKHHRPHSDEHGEGLEADIDFFAKKVHPLYHISSHGGHQQSAGYRGQRDDQTVKGIRGEVGYIPGFGIVGKLPFARQESCASSQFNVCFE